MKKLMSIILTIILAAMMCCTAAAEEIPQPEGGKKFETNWAIFDMTVRVYYEEEGYRVSITEMDPYELKGIEWEYSCFYSEEQDALLSVSSSKNTCFTDPETGVFTREAPVYQGLDDPDQTTVFTVSEAGCLLWQDGRGDDGADLVFTDIGQFEGSWISEDGSIRAEIEWSDSEIDDEYGYHVFLREGDDLSGAVYRTDGIYDPETGKLETTGTVTVPAPNADGGKEIPTDPETPASLIFSDPGNGKIRLEKGNEVIELTYDFLGGSQG